MKKLLIGMLAIASLSVLGKEGGNGGDVFHCVKNSTQNDFEGDYNLDYLLTEVENSPARVINFKSVKEYVDYFGDLLAEKFPDFAIDFNDFSKTLPIEEFSSFSNRYIWQKGSGALFNIADENMERRPPLNCKFKSQAVVKKGNIYYYDGSIFNTLPIENAKQFSYLMIHEWLRNYLVDSQTIRLVNSFLHDTQTRNLSKVEFQKRMKILSRNYQVDVVARNNSIAVVKDLLDLKDFELVINYVEVDNSLLLEKNYLIIKTFAGNQMWDEFIFLMSLIPNNDKTKIFIDNFNDRNFEVLSRIDSIIEIDSTAIEAMARGCIRDNSPLCLKALENVGIKLANVHLDFIPSYRGGNLYSDYYYDGLRIDRESFGTFALSNTKYVSIENSNLLVHAAIEGRVELFKKLSEKISSDQMISVKILKNYFGFATNCANCAMTSLSKKVNLTEVLDLRIKSLKRKIGDKELGQNIKEEILQWISDIEKIKTMI